MINYTGKGDTLTVAAPYDVASGAFALVGAGIFGEAVKAALSGAPVVLVRAGNFTGVPKATGAAWVIGDVLYWDDSAKAFTKTSSGNKRVGVALSAQASGDTTGDVNVGGPTVG